jgi:hypothetical protein
MTPDEDLDAQLRAFFGDADLGVAPRPGMAGQVLAGARRRSQARTVAVAATAIAAVSAAGAAMAATGGGTSGDPKVVPATQTPGSLCPAYGYWQDTDAGVGRLFTVYPTPIQPPRGVLTSSPHPPPTGPIPSSVVPPPEPSNTTTPLPTDRPTPEPPAGCVQPTQQATGPNGVVYNPWSYKLPETPGPWDDHEVYVVLDPPPTDPGDATDAPTPTSSR